MLNTIKNLLEGNNKKVKTVEAAKREVDKVTATENELQSQRSSVSGKINEVENALRIISANLVIDDKDKAALASKEKGTKKLESLQTEVAELDTQIANTRKKALESKNELFRSQGEEAKKVNIEVIKKQAVIQLINKFFDVDSYSAYSLKGNYQVPQDISQAYGLGDFQQLNTQEQSFILNVNKEISEKGKGEANKIVKEVFEAMKAVLDKYGVKLTDQTVERIENL
ncbi:hypothetical protein [Bacillus pseudomycoides]|uniref:hypothetical protein n=1 Tax=Bacillus pseudomycoides TaxID=64104 RepID=UPI000BEC4213|nr:hypothetical protein [Bacillus pseudomycoides]PEF21603.1 hypothetical protein CON69_26900 [Bacillus pseudomycoides]PEO42796.1 hypothetical protein CN559_23605 [Bacillus pseudomycoides]PGD71872.1 hypothetical protein COM46_24640 [Bacillus pseudomycoides]PHC37660.1 hypothetical protein COF01_13445 [Bacillus pseudomycoides]